MKSLFKIITIFLIIVLNLSSINFAETNKISEINMNINIKKDGSAEITETWKVDMYSGTELYHFLENVYEEDVSKYSVSENGTKYEFLDEWDISQSQDYKTQKAGISQNPDGIELCFGIGDYGYHVYKLNYTINNFLNEQNEINFKAIGFNTPTPEKVIIKVNGDFKNSAFAKLKNCVGTCQVKNAEAIYTVENPNVQDFITIYLNYAGEDNSIEKDEIIKITSNKNSKILNFIKKIICSLIFLLMISMFFIIFVNRRKVEKLEFKPF